MNITQDVYSQALGLSVDQREELALLLWESLPELNPPPRLEPEYEAAVLRRVEEVKSGQASTQTLEQVMANLNGGLDDASKS